MKFAINPIQWSATGDGWIDPGLEPPLPELLGEVARAGYTAVHAAPPPGGDIGAYARALAANGLSPAPGYFSAPFDDPASCDANIAAADAVAAQHEALGLTEIFVAVRMNPVRVASPARGEARDERRMEIIADQLDQAARAMLQHGVTPCLHPHVGSWIEVEAEAEWILDRIPAERLAIGADVGHLAWAGADPLKFVTWHADRVRALHIKDIRLDVARRHRDAGSGYRQTTGDHLWTEPGRGDLDLDAILDALPDPFDGWVIVEVDAPDMPTPAESARAGAQWAARAAARGRGRRSPHERTRPHGAQAPRGGGAGQG